MIENFGDNINKKGFDKCPENINKKGAPGKSITKILRELLNEKIAEVEIIYTDVDGNQKTDKIKLESKKEFNSAISIKLIQKALSGDLQSIKEILDRTEGKPTQYINNDGDSNTDTIIEYVD